MNIYWGKWIVEMLPHALRVQRIKAFCAVLAKPIVTLWIDFNVWEKHIQIKLGVTPQAIMLQKIIKDSLNITSTISEGDGKPADFVIKASVSDLNKEGQLFRLLDKYKQAGKSYRYENTEVNFKYIWSKYVDEIQKVSYRWDRSVCELGHSSQLLINYVYVKCKGPHVCVSTTYPPANDLKIYYDILYKWKLQGQIGQSRYQGFVPYGTGETGEYMYPALTREYVDILDAQISINIRQDLTYKYVLTTSIER